MTAGENGGGCSTHSVHKAVPVIRRELIRQGFAYDCIRIVRVRASAHQTRIPIPIRFRYPQAAGVEFRAPRQEISICIYFSRMVSSG